MESDGLILKINGKTVEGFAPATEIAVTPVKQVKCIESRLSNLTSGKTYDVIDVWWTDVSEGFYILDDNGVIASYDVGSCPQLKWEVLP